VLTHSRVDVAALRDGVSMSSVGWPISLLLSTFSPLSVVAVNDGHGPSPAIADGPHRVSIASRVSSVTRRDVEPQSVIGIIGLDIIVFLSSVVGGANKPVMWSTKSVHKQELRLYAAISVAVGVI
jgi:hypothetical protein